MSKKKGCSQVKVALIGPMRNLPDWNYPTFNDVERSWISSHPTDIVINPASNFDGDTTRDFSEYMQASCEGVLKAQFVILLPGWEASEGATHEVALARVTNKLFYTAEYDGSDWWFARIDPPKPDVKHHYHFLHPDTPGLATEGFEGMPASEARDITPVGGVKHDHVFPDDDPFPYEPPRTKVLNAALDAINGDRNNQYGPPTQDFQRTADMANAWGFRVGEELLAGHHVAIFMELLKVSRKRWSPGKMDHWLDTAGYSGCGWECVVEQGDADDLPAV